jgi:hypothetical protein
MIDLLARLVAVAAEFGASLMAYLWARDRARADALARLMEKQDAIRKAGELGPRTQSHAVERLHDGTF